MAIDSGAGDTVVREEMIGSVAVVDGEAKGKGVQCEVADGTLLPNTGEKSFEVVCEDGVRERMVAQVCGVSDSGGKHGGV